MQKFLYILGAVMFCAAGIMSLFMFFGGVTFSASSEKDILLTRAMFSLGGTLGFSASWEKMFRKS